MVDRTRRLLARYPVAAAALYAGLVVLFVAVAVTTALDLAQRRDEVAAAAAVLERLAARDAAKPAVAAAADAAVPPGAPFLEGATISVAGAALMQRVATAVTRTRGTILSSQVDTQGPQAKSGFVSVVMNVELDPASIQPLLYNLEAGMPFLFVDQLVIQSPTGPQKGAAAPLRVLLAVSGQWQGTSP